MNQQADQRATEQAATQLNSSDSMPSDERRSSASPGAKETEGQGLVEGSPERVADRLLVLDDVRRFRGFLGCSFEPEISDCEIIVAFADIRGFTAYCRALQKEMQDRKIQNFLRTYFKIYTDGLMQWLVHHEGDRTAEMEQIRRHMIPTMYKNLGDGMMLVWEIPSGLQLLAQGQLAQNIIYLLDTIYRRFYHYFRNLTGLALDSYSEQVTRLELGIGVAKGHAWRLDFGNSLDYAGSVINLASRLQEKARPSGVVSQYDVSNWMFDIAIANEAGERVTIGGLKGYGSDVRAWVSSQVDVNQENVSLDRPALSEGKKVDRAPRPTRGRVGKDVTAASKSQRKRKRAKG